MNPPSAKPKWSLSGRPTQNEPLGGLGDERNAHQGAACTFQWDALNIAPRYPQQAHVSIAATQQQLE